MGKGYHLKGEEKADFIIQRIKRREVLGLEREGWEIKMNLVAVESIKYVEIKGNWHQIFFRVKEIDVKLIYLSIDGRGNIIIWPQYFELNWTARTIVSFTRVMAILMSEDWRNQTIRAEGKFHIRIGKWEGA